MDVSAFLQNNLQKHLQKAPKNLNIVFFIIKNATKSANKTKTYKIFIGLVNGGSYYSKFITGRLLSSNSYLTLFAESGNIYGYPYI